IAEGARQYEERRRDREIASGEHKQVSDKLMRAGRLAAVASLAKGAGEELHKIADTHHAVLERAIAGADRGRPVAGSDLEELRRVEASLSRAVECLVEFSPRDDQGATEVDLA